MSSESEMVLSSSWATVKKLSSVAKPKEAKRTDLIRERGFELFISNLFGYSIYY